MKKCKKCGAPLEGILFNTIGKLMGIKPSEQDPEVCNKCAEAKPAEETSAEAQNETPAETSVETPSETPVETPVESAEATPQADTEQTETTPESTAGQEEEKKEDSQF